MHGTTSKRKLRIALLALALVLVLAFLWLHLMEGRYETVGTLYQSWSRWNWPIYVSSVCSTDGGVENLTIGLTDNVLGDWGERRILALVQDDTSVTFVRQEHSYRKLKRIQRWVGWTAGPIGVTQIGIDQENNCVELVLLKSVQNSPAVKEKLAWWSRRYGDAFAVRFTESRIQLD